jgi:hypothetical protein
MTPRVFIGSSSEDAPVVLHLERNLVVASP